MEPPPLNNKTAFAAHPQLVLDRDGEKLLVVVKATFEAPHDASAPLELAPRQRRRGIRLADVPWNADKPEKSSSVFPSDICLRKPGTDVIVAATAYAPEGRAVPSFDAYVRVGPVYKLLKIHGLRVWEVGGAAISAGRPIAQLPVQYEFAWGGLDDSDPGRIVEEPRNPVGMGITGDPNSLTDRPAPQIEDAARPVLSCKTRPEPAGIGPIGPHWEPRRKYAGTYDSQWLDFRAPLPPLDRDDRANLCASPGLTASPHLVGGEQVALLNLIPGGGPLAFPLPQTVVQVEFRAKGRQAVTLVPPLDTVIIDVFGIGPNQPIAVELVWRASIPAPRKTSDVTIVVREEKR